MHCGEADGGENSVVTVGCARRRLGAMSGSLVVRVFLGRRRRLDGTMGRVRRLAGRIRSNGSGLRHVVRRVVLSGGTHFKHSSRGVSGASRVSFVRMSKGVVFFGRSRTMYSLSTRRPRSLRPGPHKGGGINGGRTSVSNLPMGHIGRCVARRRLVTRFNRGN